MKKAIFIFLFLALASCNNQEALFLPKVDRTVVERVEDHSPVYIFFRKKEKDTIAEVNRNNTISTTNWVFNIDKRLPLRLVIPEVIKLQKKKSGGMHQKEMAQNYYSYADDVHKKLAFLPFTTLVYRFEKPKSGIQIYFRKDHQVFVFNSFTNQNALVKKEDLNHYLSKIISDKPNKYFFCFDKNSSYEEYIKNKIFIMELSFQTLSLTNQEFIY